MNNQECDLIVIGSGISGLTAAITAAEGGADVIIITKTEDPLESNTFYAQGGIVGTGSDDNVTLLSRDIIKAGSGINYRNAVNRIASEGPSLVDDFLREHVGISFSEDSSGNPQLTKEAAHSVRRIYHSKDQTGRAIQTGLMKYARNIPSIRFFSSCMAIDLITNSHHSTDSQERYKKTRVIGAYVLDERNGEVVSFFSSGVVLATGGLGNIYQHTSNPSLATGDGLAMAYRAGAPVINCEFVQFHPTTLYHRDVKNFLISESLRGEGARLINKHGETFMNRYHNLGDLAPRDEVSLAISKEMEKSECQYVLLDATAIRGMDLKDRFPGIYEKCSSIDIDISREPIPVVPAAHYFCGGVKAAMDGTTELEGLYAVGETACTGLHGANRLASVSLLEGLVMGYKMGKLYPRKAKSLPKKLINSIPDWVYASDQDDFDSTLIKNDMADIQVLMWNYAGIIRTRKRLNRALSDLNYLSHRIERFYKEAVLTRELIELRNSVIAATQIARSARMNTRSIGCHYIKK